MDTKVKSGAIYAALMPKLTKKNGIYARCSALLVGMY
jgi:hypothetical protein